MEKTKGETEDVKRETGKQPEIHFGDLEKQGGER
jgi:hypothetical protein